MRKCSYLKSFNGQRWQLTHRGRKMADIFQTTFWNGFSWIKIDKFWLKFHWNLFLEAQLTMFQHWFTWWLGTGQATSHYLNQPPLQSWCHGFWVIGDTYNQVIYFFELYNSNTIFMGNRLPFKIIFLFSFRKHNHHCHVYVEFAAKYFHCFISHSAIK